MHLRLLTLIGLVLTGGMLVQAQSPDDSAAPKRSREELRDLLGPIALYPDPLISLILPASTVPSDVVLAARFVKAGSDPEAAQDKSWDSSVKALVRYPDTLTWLDENLEWTTQVGDAFVDQPVDVMDVIQDLRAKARAVGNLVDTPQQRIVQEDNDIRIVPAQPEYIYEPRYDPQVVYYDRPVAEPLLYFGAPLLVGAWLGYDCDWRRHRLYRGEWHEGWDYDRARRGREDVYINNRLTDASPWHVDSKRHSMQVRRPGTERSLADRVRPVVVRPTPLASHIKSGDVRRGETVGGPDRRHEGSGKGETIRRGEAVMGSGRAEDKGGKGKVIVPKTIAPTVNGDGRKSGEGRSHMESKGDSPKPKSEVPKPHVEVLKPKSESPRSKGEEPRSHSDTPKGESSKSRGETPKPHVDSPKPKSESPRAHSDAPKPKSESPKPHAEAPKPKSESPKPHAEAPKPKSEAPKSHSDNSKDSKKKDKDKDKKN